MKRKQPEISYELQLELAIENYKAYKKLVLSNSEYKKLERTMHCIDNEYTKDGIAMRLWQSEYAIGMLILIERDIRKLELNIAKEEKKLQKELSKIPKGYGI